MWSGYRVAGSASPDQTLRVRAWIFSQRQVITPGMAGVGPLITLRGN